MLNHISPIFSPELLAAVYAMGHGDTIVLADGNFPSDGVSRRGAAEIIRADGHGIPELLDAVQRGLFDKAKKNLDEHIFEAHSLEEAKQLQEEKGGFIKTMWCGELDCEMKMKEEAGMSSRCMPLEQEHLDDVCPICGRAAKKMIYWGVAY